MLERFQALESTIRNLSDEMRSYYQSFAQLLHWLEDVFRRIYPAAAHAASATKPPLGPLDTSSHRGGGGPKRDRALQKPFRDELRHRMGLQPRDPLPPFEESPPSLHGGPALRFDWSQRPDAYTELVESIIRELCSGDRCSSKVPALPLTPLQQYLLELLGHEYIHSRLFCSNTRFLCLVCDLLCDWPMS